MSLIMQLLGAEEVAGAIDRKAKKVPRAIRNAMRRGSTKMSQAIKAALKRRRTGLLAKSIGNKTVEKFGAKARVTALAGARRGFAVTLKSVQVATKGKALASLARDKEGRQLYEVVGERKKTGKVFKTRTTAALFGSRTRGKNKGKAYLIDPVRYAHLVEGGHKRGKGRSAAKPYPFMGEAAKVSFPQVKQDIRDAMVQEILRG